MVNSFIMCSSGLAITLLRLPRNFFIYERSRTFSNFSSFIFHLLIVFLVRIPAKNEKRTGEEEEHRVKVMIGRPFPSTFILFCYVFPFAVRLAIDSILSHANNTINSNRERGKSREREKEREKERKRERKVYF